MGGLKKKKGCLTKGSPLNKKKTEKKRVFNEKKKKRELSNKRNKSALSHSLEKKRKPNLANCFFLVKKITMFREKSLFCFFCSTVFFT